MIDFYWKSRMFFERMFFLRMFFVRMCLCKWPSRENFLDYKKAKNTCNNLSKFTKSYFDKVTSKGFVSNKAFWNTVKPFLTNKGFLTNANITIKHKDKIVNDNSKLAHLFNSHYINIVENTSGMPPENIGNLECKSDDHFTVEKIIKHYKNHASIEKIRSAIKKRILISLQQPQKK